MVTQRENSFEQRVSKVLQEVGFITADQIERAREVSQQKGAGLLDTIVAQGMVARETLVTVLSFQLRVPLWI